MIVRRREEKIDEQIGDAHLHRRMGDVFKGTCGCKNSLTCSNSQRNLAKRGKATIRCSDCRNTLRYGTLIGKRFGRLRVIRQAHSKASYSAFKRLWLTECDCGNKEIMFGDYLMKKVRIECSKCAGRKEIGDIKSKRTHLHLKKNYLFSACNNKTSCHYMKFGALGITVSDEWKKFKDFARWARSKQVRLTKDKHVYLKRGKSVFCAANCFVRDKVKFTPYLDPTYLPNMNKQKIKFVKSSSRPVEDIIVDHPFKRVGFFSKLKAWLWGGKRVA